MVGKRCRHQEFEIVRVLSGSLEQDCLKDRVGVSRLNYPGLSRVLRRKGSSSVQSGHDDQHPGLKPLVTMCHCTLWLYEVFYFQTTSKRGLRKSPKGYRESYFRFHDLLIVIHLWVQRWVYVTSPRERPGKDYGVRRPDSKYRE